MDLLAGYLWTEVNPQRKIFRLKNIQIRVDGASGSTGVTGEKESSVLVMTHVNGLTFKSSQRGTINRRPCLKHSLLLSIVG